MVKSIDKFTFLVNGISSLLGWNVILNSLDYFQACYPEANVNTQFPIPYFIAYTLIGLGFHFIHSKMTLKQMIVTGLIITNVALVLMLLVSTWLKNSTGYIIQMLLCALLGVGGNMTQLSFFATINYLSGDIVGLFNFGTGLSGLVVSFFRIIILAVKGPDSNNLSAIVLYFIIALVLNTFDLFLNIKFFMSPTYHELVEPHQHPKQDEDTEGKSEAGYFHRLLEAHKDVAPSSTLIFLNYVLTFMLFPAMTLKKPFTWGGAWPYILLLTCYGLGDTLGKLFTTYRSLYNRLSINYSVFSRVYFFWTIIILTKNISDPLLSSDAFAFVNQFIFGLSNGIATNGNFVLAFEQATVKTRKYAGVLCGLCLQIGILAGTVLAVPLSYI